MSNEIKVAYLTGKTLTANVLQATGAVRQTGISLTEVAAGGLYLGNCATIQPGDIVIIYEGANLIGSTEYKPWAVTGEITYIEPELWVSGAYTWTIAQICAKVRSLAGVPDTTQISTADIYAKINDFYRNRFPLEIDDQKLNGWYERTLLATDSGDYDLSDDILKLLKPAFIDENIVPIYQDSDEFFLDYPRIDTGAAYCITSPGLAIGTNTKKVKNSSFSFRTNDSEYSFTKTTGETALLGVTIPQSKYGCWRLEIDSNLTVHIVEAADNAIGYSTAAEAMQGLAQESDVNACMGFVTVINTSGTFIPGTTALNASGVTATFTNGFVSTRGIPEAVLLEDGILYVRSKPWDIFSFRVYAKLKPAALESGDSPLSIDWGPLIATGTAIEIVIELGFSEEKVAKLKSIYDYQKMLLDRRFASQFYSGAQRAEMAF